MAEDPRNMPTAADYAWDAARRNGDSVLLLQRRIERLEAGLTQAQKALSDHLISSSAEKLVWELRVSTLEEAVEQLTTALEGIMKILDRMVPPRT